MSAHSFTGSAGPVKRWTALRSAPRERWLVLLCLLCAVTVWAKPDGGLTPPMPGFPSEPKAPPDALLSAVDEITRQVETLRGLKLLSPFQRGVLSSDEIGQKLKQRIDKEYSPQEVRMEAGVLKRLGLLQEKADYEKLLFDLLKEQVAGFYDPYAKTLYVADWLPLEMQRPAMAHEIEHALQDQHFDLKRFSQPLKEDGDRQLARAAVVEGDGTAVMLEFAAQSMGLKLSKIPEMASRLGRQMLQMSLGATPSFRQAPAVLRETLVFPYAYGLDFVESIRLKKPWTDVNELFKNPPDSTEQIMHPAKYWAHEAPVPITEKPLPSLGGYKVVRRDVLGEMVFKIWFGSKLGEQPAERAAAGWGGDRIVAYAAPGAADDTLPLVILLSSWDTEQDAREAERAAQQVVSGLGEPAPGLAPAGGGVPEALGNLTERRGLEVLAVLGAPKARLPKVADEIFHLWRVGAPGPRSGREVPETAPVPAQPRRH